MDNYGDTLPSRKPVAAPYFPYEDHDALTETSSFHVADTFRSMDNETYDFSDFPEDVVRNRNDETKFNVLMTCVSLMLSFGSLIKDVDDDMNSGQLLSITEFMGDGSPSARHARIEKPKRPMVGISQYPRYDTFVQRPCVHE